MKPKSKATPAQPPAVTSIEFTTALNADSCRHRLVEASQKPSFGNERVEVNIQNDHFTIRVISQLDVSSQGNSDLPRAVCIGDLTPVHTGTQVTAKAEIFYDYPASLHYQQEALRLIALVWILVAVGFTGLVMFQSGGGESLIIVAAVFDLIALFMLFYSQFGLDRQPRAPDFAKWLYRLLFELETEH